jgi:hypothetical protein
VEFDQLWEASEGDVWEEEHFEAMKEENARFLESIGAAGDAG